MRRLLVGVLGSLMLAASALAQAPPPPPPITITGGFVIDGVTGGVVGGVAGQIPARDGQQPAKPGTATLRGRVIAADTGEPLRKAQVRITGGQPAVGQPPENRLTTTDVGGRYEFKEVRAGRYSINAQKGSFVGLQWGQQRPNEPGKPLDVADGQTIERVDFALPRGGVITGRILDEFGDPISDVQVGAMRYQVVNGGRRLINAGRMAQTNDIGEYRLYALPPGDYYVSATLRNFNPLAESDDRSGYAPTYYPGTSDVAGAQKLTLGVGQTINDINLSLLPIRTSRVSGTAVDAQGRPIRGNVQAFPRSSDFFGGPFNVAPGQIRPDGSFTINGLAPGDYTLQAQNQFGGPGGPIPPNDIEFASADVTVGGGDVTGVVLTAVKPSTISGRIVIGSGDGSTLKTSAIRVGAFPAPTNGVNFGPFPQPIAIAEDWTFQAKARQGQTRLQVQGMQPPWNIKAVRYRGFDVIDSGLEVRPGEDLTGVEIEITNKATDLSGLVTNTRGEPVKDYWVVVFHRDREKWKPPSRYIRTSRPDQDGRFKMAGVPPGDYLIVASDTLDPLQATDPDYLDRIQNRGSRFSLGEGETKTLDLKLALVP